jgi:hypothetical protein
VVIFDADDDSLLVSSLAAPNGRIKRRQSALAGIREERDFNGIPIQGLANRYPGQSNGVTSEPSTDKDRNVVLIDGQIITKWDKGQGFW